MDYDTDEKSMATLRRHLRGAREEYYRYKRYLLLTYGLDLFYSKAKGKRFFFFFLSKILWIT